jgi:tetratricopeptide (TPR) repeat protein
MNRARWQKVESIFQGALERPLTARSAYLDEACAGDRALRAEVEGLLEEHATEPEFMQAPLLEPARDLPPISLTPNSGQSGGHTGGHDDGQTGGQENARIGQYRIIRKLGAGGMGKVYLAMHEGPGFERAVALKVIHDGLDTDEVLRRFQLERRILAALKHANVARLIDAGQTPDGRPYFVMDFVEGVTIDVYCEREQLSLRQRLLLFQKICDAVQHAHNNLVIHRDLKPSNILVAKDGTPVLLDFGIGKVLKTPEILGSPEPDAAGTPKTGLRAFTPEYAAPEQVRGDPVSVATDVYGLGLLLYRILTGQRPFDPGNGYEYEKAVLEKEPTRPSIHGGRALRGDLDTIILKALRKEPERRYSSVAALSDDVQRYLEGLPVRARADTFGYRTGKFVRRHRLALAAAVVVFTALSAATLYSRAQTRVVTRERDKAIEVQTFLLEMFGSMGPGRSDSVSVRQLLAGQAALAQNTYGNRPELLAQMQMVIGEGFDRLGLFAPAESLFTSALATRRAALASDHADIAISASMLGWVNFERGRAPAGEVLLREAVNRWPDANPYNPAMHARSMNDLGVVLEAQGKYDEAVELYRQTLLIRRRLFGDSNRAVGVTLNNLAMATSRKGNFTAAVAIAETALVVMRRVSGMDHQRSTLIQGNLANLKSQLGDVAGAEAQYRDLLARQVRVSGAQHPVTAFSQLNFASVLRSQGKLAEAETLLVQSLASFEKAYGPEHNRVGLALAALGGVRSELGRHREAKPLLERAVAMQKKVRGETHRETSAAIAQLGAMHANMGNWAEAERVLREAMGVMVKALGDKHIETAGIRARVAQVVAAQGKREEALSLYRQARADLTAAGVLPTSPVLRDIASRLDSLER